MIILQVLVFWCMFMSRWWSHVLHQSFYYSISPVPQQILYRNKTSWFDYYFCAFVFKELKIGVTILISVTNACWFGPAFLCFNPWMSSEWILINGMIPLLFRELSFLCFLKWMMNWVCTCSSLKNAACNVISCGLIWKTKINLLSTFLLVNTIYFEYKKTHFPCILICIFLVSLIHSINSFPKFFANVFNSTLQNWVVLTQVYTHTAHF